MQPAVVVANSPFRSAGISATSNYNRGAAALSALGLALGASVKAAPNDQGSRSRNNDQGSRSSYTQKQPQVCKTRTGWRGC